MILKNTYKSLFSGFFTLLLSCGHSPPDDVAQPKVDPEKSLVTINWENEKQVMIGNGINFEGYHSTGGGEVLSQKFENMLSTLPSQVVRLSLPLKVWEPENDNADVNTMDFTRFNDSEGAHYTFLRLQEMEKRGISSWLSIWDMAHWNIKDSSKTAARRILNLDEMVESIGAFLLYGKDKYHVEPLYISVNEPTIASENGWGGYQIALSPDEQISIIAKAGAWFKANGIKTKWIIALHKIYPSELAQAKQIFENTEVKKYAAGFDFHGYSMQKIDYEPYLKTWGEWVKTTGLPTFCGECDYDNKFWENPERDSWINSSTHTGTLIFKVLNMAEVNGILPWYGNAAEANRPYRYIAKHFMETFKAGTIIVKSSDDHPNILVTAGKNNGKFTFHIQNTSNKEISIQVADLPVDQLQWIRSKDQSYYEVQQNPEIKNRTLNILLQPYSFNTFSGN